MLKKMVDGKEIICSEEEEALIRKKWFLNETYPDYRGHLMFGGICEPSYNMPGCIGLFLDRLRKAVQLAIDDINAQIESAQEEDEPSLVQELIKKRKQIKILLNVDVSKVKTIDDLISLQPTELKNYWNLNG